MTGRGRAGWVCVGCALALLSRPLPARAEERERLQGAGVWVADGVIGAAWLALIPAAIGGPAHSAVIGPSFRGPEDVERLATAAEAGQLGRRLTEDASIDDATVMLAAVGSLVGTLAIGIGLAPSIDAERHSVAWVADQAVSQVVGALQTLVGSIVLTYVAKNWVGRLRPDFADRADRYYCWLDDVPYQYEPRCTSLRSQGLLGPPVDEGVVREGRRSFWSGHAAIGFASLSYAALVIGGRMVWGRSSTWTTRPLGLVLQAAAFSAAAIMAYSRIPDGLHNPDDVLVGSMAGMAIASAFYFMHFDAEGEARARVSVSATPLAQGLGASVGGSF